MKRWGAFLFGLILETLAFAIAYADNFPFVLETVARDYVSAKKAIATIQPHDRKLTPGVVGFDELGRVGRARAIKDGSLAADDSGTVAAISIVAFMEMGERIVSDSADLRLFMDDGRVVGVGLPEVRRDLEEMKDSRLFLVAIPLFVVGLAVLVADHLKSREEGCGAGVPSSGEAAVAAGLGADRVASGPRREVGRMRVVPLNVALPQEEVEVRPGRREGESVGDSLSLSNVERLLLVNQFMILARLYPEEAEHFALQRKLVEDGYTQLYQELFKPLGQEVSRDRCELVLSVLDMYRSLVFSNEKLPEDQRLPADSLSFPGFDGNNESELLGFAKFLTADLGRYNELTDKAPIMNSHMPKIDAYERMLKVWRDMKGTEPLTRVDIDRILAAQRWR